MALQSTLINYHTLKMENSCFILETYSIKQMKIILNFSLCLDVLLKTCRTGSNGFTINFNKIPHAENGKTAVLFWKHTV